MYKCAQFTEKGGPLTVVQRAIPEPKAGQVLIHVQACGLCHGDTAAKFGFMGNSYPIVPGHEVAGVVTKVGEGVTRPKVGQHVGVGWHGGHCFTCQRCLKGDFMMCSQHRVSGVHLDGGYAEYMIAPAEATAIIPEGVTAEDAAAYMCAGLTCYNALRNSGARGGDVVAVQGMGGLGHMGVQYASKMGFITVAISSGSDKLELAKQLGAHHYIDSSKQNGVEELQKLGGAKVILATAPNAKAISDIVPGLTYDGNLIVVAAPPEPLTISPILLLSKRLRVSGWASGGPKDAEETMQFSHKMNIKAMTEVYPLDKAQEAFDRMMSTKAKFRVVLKP